MKRKYDLPIANIIYLPEEDVIRTSDLTIDNFVDASDLNFEILNIN